MGLLARLGGLGSVDDLAGVMREEKSQETAIRIVLYENPKRINDAFAQRLPNVVERVTNGELTAEVSGGVAAIFSTKLGGSLAASQRIEVTPLMQVLLLEEAAAEDGWLVDLGTRPGRLGDQLLRFTGTGRIFGPGQPINDAGQFALGDELADALQSVREAQEALMRAQDHDHPGTFVWVARGAGPIAAIANFRGADENFNSYSVMPPYGVLGHYEGGPEPLTRIAPLMIWHLASDAFRSDPAQAQAVGDYEPEPTPAREVDTAARPQPAATQRSPLADYEVLGTIHTGLYGRVLKCRRDGVLCVVKETTAPASRAALEALIDLRCPNLAAPTHIWEAADMLFEELPYVDGITLSELVRNSRSPVRGALLTSLQAHLAGVLRILHANALLHRDIHPDNVFLVVRPAAGAAEGDHEWSWEAFSSPDRQTAAGQAGERQAVKPSKWACDLFGTQSVDTSFLAAWVLGDCTFAIRTDDPEQAEFRHGNYTPPEQVSGSATRASDMFGLGATLYYAMVGHEPPPLHAGKIEISQGEGDNYALDRYVERLLSARPQDRPSADERLREGSVLGRFCGALNLGSDTYLVMDTLGVRSALLHGRAAVRALTGSDP